MNDDRDRTKLSFWVTASTGEDDDVCSGVVDVVDGGDPIGRGVATGVTPRSVG